MIIGFPSQQLWRSNLEMLERLIDDSRREGQLIIRVGTEKTKTGQGLTAMWD